MILDSAIPSDNGLEKELDKKIAKYCKLNKLYSFHDRSIGKNAAGHPDWIIAIPRGKTLWIENKSRVGKISDKQRLVLEELDRLGHSVHICRSYNQFLQIISDAQKNVYN